MVDGSTAARKEARCCMMIVFNMKMLKNGMLVMCVCVSCGR